MLPAAAAKLTADENLRALDGLRFLWLELTNRCNLTCAHCNAESGPRPSRKDVLTTADYKRLLEEAAAGLPCGPIRWRRTDPALRASRVDHAGAGPQIRACGSFHERNSPTRYASLLFCR